MPNDSVRQLTGPGSPFLHPDSVSFGLADAGAIERSVLAAGRRLRSQLLQFNHDLAAGRISLQGYTVGTRNLIRSIYFATYSLGAISVFPFYTVTETDIGILDDELATESGFLRRFGGDIVHDRVPVSGPVSIVARTNLYALALRGIFERGRLEAMPAGPYRWQLGITDHCPDCIRSSISGPYQKNSRSGLGLPSLPGVPGDGRVCDGLTRCGCSISLASGIPIPNQELSQNLHRLLSEVVNGSSHTAQGPGAD